MEPALVKPILSELLKSKPSPEEITALSFDLSVDYMPSDVTRKKMGQIETDYDVEIIQTDFSFSGINTYLKDTLLWGIVKFTLKHPEFKGGVKRIMGTASFYAGQYKGNWSLAQVAESLATVKAFSKHWEWFGKGLNNKEEDHNKFMNQPRSEKQNNIAHTVKTVLKG